MVGAETILEFWLEETGPAQWYKPTAELDETIRERFSEALTAARAGKLDHWLLKPQSALALLILLDQFPRNMFRGDGAAFAGDAKARAVAKRALSLGHDLKVEGTARQFFYLPLMHSECLIDQDRCVRLVTTRLPENRETLKHACLHRDVIRRFGRFPYRNEALGRRSSVSEQQYLDEGGYRP